MKPKQLSIIILLIVFLLSGCKEEKTVPCHGYSRIVLKESQYINSNQFMIIEVDSVEYLANDWGGLIRLSK